MNFYRLTDIDNDHDRQQAKSTYQHNITPNMHPIDKADLLHYIVRGYLEQHEFRAQA